MIAPNQRRIIYFDVLRIIAAFAVVMLHVCAQRFYSCYPSDEWNVRNFYDSLVRWAVPIFVMISGALFLDLRKNLSIRALYTKNIARIVFILITWSIINALYRGFAGDGFEVFLIKVIEGPNHFWFLKFLIGLYVSVPLLRAVVANKKLERYFICLSVVFTLFIPMFFPLIGLVSENLMVLVERFYNELEIQIASGFLGYFVLGHYLNTTDIKKKYKRIAYILGGMSVLAVFLLTSWFSHSAGKPFTLLYEGCNLFTFFESVALFLFIKDLQIAPKYDQTIVGLSKLTLGVYIIHPPVMSIPASVWGIDSASLNPVFFIPLYALMVFLICCAIVALMIRIPVIKKLVT